MPQEKLKVVFDCNIIWQAFFFELGVSAECKKLVDDDKVTLITSAEVLEEMREVMTRPEAKAKYNVTDEAVEKYLESLAKKSVFIRTVPKKFSYPRDPDDEPYINLAIEAGADLIVTRDRDLLDLMTGYTDECKEFRQRFRPLKVIDPLELLEKVREAQEERK